jgi:hypothetical protein
MRLLTNVLRYLELIIWLGVCLYNRVRNSYFMLCRKGFLINSKAKYVCARALFNIDTRVIYSKQIYRSFLKRTVIVNIASLMLIYQPNLTIGVRPLFYHQVDLWLAFYIMAYVTMRPLWQDVRKTKIRKMWHLPDKTGRTVLRECKKGKQTPWEHFPHMRLLECCMPRMMT